MIKLRGLNTFSESFALQSCRACESDMVASDLLLLFIAVRGPCFMINSGPFNRGQRAVLETSHSLWPVLTSVRKVCSRSQQTTQTNNSSEVVLARMF